MLDIFKIYKFHSQVLAFTLNKSDEHKFSSVALQTVSSIHNYNTRSSARHDLVVEVGRRIGYKSFNARLAREWNELPDIVKSLPLKKLSTAKFLLKQNQLSLYIT